MLRALPKSRRIVKAFSVFFIDTLDKLLNYTNAITEKRKKVCACFATEKQLNAMRVVLI